MLRYIRLARRLHLLIALFAFGFLAYGVWSFKTLQEVKVGGPIFDRIEQNQILVADILPPPFYIIESYLVCLQLSQEKMISSVVN